MDFNNKNQKEKDSFSFQFVVYQNDDSIGHDSDGLEIDEGESTLLATSPKAAKNARKAIQLDPNEKTVLKNIEEEIERQLDEKAAKSNMSVKNVKNILKHIITNEQVLALVRHSVNEEPFDSKNLTYEPKLTRAKVKELFKDQTKHVRPTPNHSSVHVLIDKELSEDEEDEEYIPGEDESDDDPDASIASDLESHPQTPATPSTLTNDCGTQTSWTDDGLFKLPNVTSTPISGTSNVPDIESEENIALRTRSKLSLSDTPLECIEQAFVPPDITTDMYDIECDDEDWGNFLKEFTQPLPNANTTNAEDDDETADPEYNILADEEINTMDKEELRADRGVKVTKRELNELISELLDYVNLYSPPLYTNEENTEQQKTDEVNTNIQLTEFKKNQEKNDICCANVSEAVEVKAKVNDKTDTLEPINEEQQVTEMQETNIGTEFVSENACYPFSLNQLLLLRQQIRQYIQLLTQMYLQTYHHPFYNEYSPDIKARMIKIDEKIKENKKSVFAVENFYLSLDLINRWDSEMCNDEEYAKYIEKQKQNCTNRLKSYNFYPWTYYKKIRWTILKNEVFMYPGLLPATEMKVGKKDHGKWLKSEEGLLACGLEQFTEYIESKQEDIGLFNKKAKLMDVCTLVSKYMMPHRCPKQILCRVRKAIGEKLESNPIYYFYKYKKTIQQKHFVNPVVYMIPPLNQPEIFLPELWRKYQQAYKNLLEGEQKKGPKRLKPLLPNVIQEKINSPQKSTIWSLKKITKPPKYNKFTKNKVTVQRTLAKKFVPKPKLENVNQTNPCNVPLQPPIFDNKMSSTNDQKICETVEITDLQMEAKDNVEEINALVKASSTIKVKPKRILNNASEKKKAKQQKEYETTIALLSPDDPKIAEEKANHFAKAYFHKVKERLTRESPDDYNLFLSTLSDHDESIDSVTDLYTKVTSILSPKHPDLCEEFITFLTPAQAKAIEKLIPHFMYNSMASFLKKLETYYCKQPAQIRKVYTGLTELSDMGDSVSLEMVKSTVLPLLKGNSLLVDSFLQIFPQEKPPDSLMTVWEEIDCDNHTNKAETSEVFSVLNLPEVVDPYGGLNCVCSCHQTTDEQFASRQQHCIPCGTKFIQGKIFIQTGKGPRPASITFPGSSMAEQTKRLTVSPTCRQKRRSETASPTKHLSGSPCKGNHLESIDEDESASKNFKNSSKIVKVPANKSPKIRNKTTKPKPLKCTVKNLENPSKPMAKSNNPDVKSPLASPTRENKPEFPSNKSCITDNFEFEDKLQEHTKQESENEAMEWDDCTASNDFRLSPNRSIESIDMCEESSQDLSECNDEAGPICSESDNDSIVESIHSDSSSPIHHSEDSGNHLDINETDELKSGAKSRFNASWTREEDKIILETFQHECDSENTFEIIRQLIPQRTVIEIRERFQTLMNLLLQINDSD